MRARAAVVAAVLLAATVAVTVPTTASAASAGQRMAASCQARLHTSGRYVVNAAGNRFRLVAGNGHDASGTWDGSGDSTDPAHNHADPGDWRAADWHRLVAATGLTGAVPVVRRWNMLSTDHTDQVEALSARALGDWASGARKASCPGASACSD